MDIIENIREGLRSINANLLRSVLTALIVAIGITSLVAILTAIDGMKASIYSSFSNLGANSFTLESKSNRNRSSQGKDEKKYEQLDYYDCKRFKQLYDYTNQVSINTYVSGSAEVKRLSKITNPNIRIIGADDEFINLAGWNIARGRNFSSIEIKYGRTVAIVGQEIVNTLFEKNEEALNQFISFYGRRAKIIGIMKKEGALGGDSGSDRSVIIPIENATRLNTGRTSFWYNVDVGVENMAYMEHALGQARGLMRSIRRDPIGQDDSFEIKRNQTLEEELDEISSYMKIGGGIIGFITLLGASVGLMNIMLVSVTERTREIGIRKAIGATPKKIRQQFLIEAIVICILGGIGGVIFGLVIGNFLASIIAAGAFVIPWMWIIGGFTICIIVGLISGSYPAFKASRLDPIESLRFE